MRRSWYVVTLVVLLASVWASPVWADDANPPPWRGQPGTTYARWEFSTDNPNPAPDEEYNPNGPSQTQVTPGPGMGWLPELDGRFGVWQLSGRIEIGIPNYPPAGPLKYIWVQLTWQGQSPGRPTVSETISGEIGRLLDEQAASPWLHSTFVIDIEPNPQYEVVSIEGPINVDEVVIDTICIPEPSSLAVFSVGLLGLAGAVRRKRR